MKKVLALGLISFAFAQAQLFVGVQGSYDLGAEFIGSGKFDSAIYSGRTSNDGWSAGLSVGNQHNFGRMGLRYFVSADYAQALSYSNTHLVDVDLNVDGILNFTSSGSFGLFFGLGTGYEIAFVDGNASGTVPLFGRLGLTFTAASKHKIDIGVKLPISGWNVSGGLDTHNSPLRIQAGYKYLF